MKEKNTQGFIQHISVAIFMKNICYQLAGMFQAGYGRGGYYIITSFLSGYCR